MKRSPDERHTNTWKFHWYVLTITCLSQSQETVSDNLFSWYGTGNNLRLFPPPFCSKKLFYCLLEVNYVLLSVTAIPPTWHVCKWLLIDKGLHEVKFFLYECYLLINEALGVLAISSLLIGKSYLLLSLFSLMSLLLCGCLIWKFVLFQCNWIYTIKPGKVN